MGEDCSRESSVLENVMQHRNPTSLRQKGRFAIWQTQVMIIKTLSKCPAPIAILD
jgi:hypothetical protein